MKTYYKVLASIALLAIAVALWLGVIGPLWAAAKAQQKVVQLNGSIHVEQSRADVEREIHSRQLVEVLMVGDRFYDPGVEVPEKFRPKHPSIRVSDAESDGLICGVVYFERIDFSDKDTVSHIGEVQHAFPCL